MSISKHSLPSFFLLLVALAPFSHAQSYAASTSNAAAAAAAQVKIHQHHHIMILAHGWCMGVAFAVLFPVGAMLLHLLGGRTRHVAWIHGIWQLFSLMLGIAGAGLGGWLVANESRDFIRGNGHPLIGIIVLGGLVLQPIGGALAHHLFVQKGAKTTVHVAHRWFGRVLLVLGGINGGLGLMIARKPKSYILIPYAVVAGVVFAAWGGVLVWAAVKTRKTGTAGRLESSGSETEVEKTAVLDKRRGESGASLE